MAFGTLVTGDSLQSLKVTNGTVATYGEDRIFEVILAALLAQNRIAAELISELCEVTTNRLFRYGGDDTMEMEELGEWGLPEAEKVKTGAEVGLPLVKYGKGLQWTRDAFRVMQVRQIAAQVIAMLNADTRRIIRQIRRALYYPTSYTFYDRLIDSAALPLRPLLNADSDLIPVGPNGESFDGATHTHYLANATLTTTIIDSLISTVVEHYGSGQIMLAIGKANEAGFRGLSGFVAYNDPRIIKADNVDRASSPLDLVNYNNRAIGIYNGAEVWVKPWAVDNYPFCWLKGQRPPLRIRVRGDGEEGIGGNSRSILAGTSPNLETSFGDLELVVDNEAYPLRAKAYVREFGVSGYERTNGAVARVNNGTYAAPTIN